MQKLQSKNKIIVIGGPTAVGKTAASIAVAKKLDAEIVSSDSRQIYRQVNIGTAKIKPSEMKGVRHHLLNILSLDEKFSAADFVRLADQSISRIHERGKKAVVCGGTGFYIKSLLWKLDDVPKVPRKIIEKVHIDLENHGLEKLRDELAQRDPEYYQKIDQQNPHRIIRAISVIRSTDRPISSFRKEKAVRRYTSINILLERPRDELYARINQRVDEMIDLGLVEECRSVLDYRNHQCLQTVGYRQIFEFLDGNLTLDEATDRIKTKTRQYAKRQLTWFSNQDQWKSFHPHDIDGIAKYIRESFE